MKHSIFSLILFTTIIFSACNKEESETFLGESKMRINHFKTFGFPGFSPALNLSTQNENKFDTDEWYNFYNSIDGFNYELGYIYEVSVLVYEIANPPADASAYRYELKELISKEKVNADIEFELYVKDQYDSEDDSRITGNLDEGFKISHQYNIDCNDICNELEELQNYTGMSGVFGTFKHSGDSDTIELQSLRYDE